MCTSVAGAALLGLPFAMGLLGESVLSEVNIWRMKCTIDTSPPDLEQCYVSTCKAAVMPLV